jgi:beta-lactamase class C
MIRKRPHIFFYCIVFLLIFNPPPLFCSEKEGIDGVLSGFDAYVSKFIKEQEAPGAAIAIVIDGRIVSLKGYGVKKAGGAEPIDIHTAFRIASLSKSFAAVLTGTLVEDRLLGWDDKVTTYLPGLMLAESSNTEELTIRHILSHTSGLIPHAYDNLIEAEVPFKKIIKELEKVDVICPVGECYTYQNAMYSLIGPIIESATHKKYEELLRERLIHPLGMKDVTFSRHGLIASANYAHPHVKKEGKWTPTVVKDTYYNVQPAAGINASIHDMAYWLKAGFPETRPFNQ